MVLRNRVMDISAICRYKFGIKLVLSNLNRGGNADDMACRKYHVDRIIACGGTGGVFYHQEQAESKKIGQRLRLRMFGLQRMQLYIKKRSASVKCYIIYEEDKYEVNRLKGGYAG